MNGNPLPKKLLRPFGLVEHVSIDDNKLVLIAANDKTELFNVISVVIFVIAIAVLIGWTAKYNVIELVSGLFLLGISLVLYLFSKHLKPKKFEVFDRQNGKITIPKPFSNRIWISAPWDEWEGRITWSSTTVGTKNHYLRLIHKPSCKSWVIFATGLQTEVLLAFWSFLVQYMDKNQPLPNVDELSKYGQTTEGLGNFETFERNVASQKLKDPWLEWKAQVSANPALDMFKDL